MCGRGGVKGGRARGGIREFSVEDYEEIVENSNEGNIRTFSVSLGSETRAWERRMQRRRRGVIVIVVIIVVVPGMEGTLLSLQELVLQTCGVLWAVPC